MGSKQVEKLRKEKRERDGVTQERIKKMVFRKRKNRTCI